MIFTPEQKKEIAKILDERLKTRGKNGLFCPICGNNNFIMTDASSVITLNNSNDANSLIIGGPSIPCVNIACNNCGNILHFSLGVLNKDLFK